MYDQILKALFRMHNRTTVDEQIRYLAELKPAARSLWNAYRPQDGTHVTVGYKDPGMQAVYMIRYFPQYSQMIRIVLNSLKTRVTLPFNQEFLYASFFGSGPTPELYGFLQFLKKHFPAAQMVVAHAFDLAGDGWAPAQDITLNQLLPGIWDKQLLQVCPVPFDISQPGSVASITRAGGENPISESSLIVCQNCLNEISMGRHRIVRDNFAMLIRMMSKGALLVVIDRQGYPGVRNLLRDISKAATAGSLAEVLMECIQLRQFDCNPVLDRIPEMITAHLLVRRMPRGPILPEQDGLVCARGIKYYMSGSQKAISSLLPRVVAIDRREIMV